MKKHILIFTIISFTFFGCKNEIKNSNLRIIDLKNNLGMLTIEIPNFMDTSYTWTKQGCTNCDTYSMMRFADKRYSLLEEMGGFGVNASPDSLYQLTISRLANPKCKEITRKFDYVNVAKNYYLKFKGDCPKSNPDVKILFVNKREYVVALQNTTKNNKCDIELIASTFIDGEVVTITYNYYGSNRTSFIKEIKESLNTLKIIENNKK